MGVCHLFCLLEGGVEKERKKVKEPLSPLGFRGKRSSLCGSCTRVLLGKGEAGLLGIEKLTGDGARGRQFQRDPSGHAPQQGPNGRSLWRDV